MDNQQDGAKTIEEEWILKYRAAISAVPIKPPRAVRLRASIDNTCRLVVSNVGRIVRQWIQTHPPAPRLRGNVVPIQHREPPSRKPQSFPISEIRSKNAV
jgi:hypothetical protein